MKKIVSRWLCLLTLLIILAWIGSPSIAQARLLSSDRGARKQQPEESARLQAPVAWLRLPSVAADAPNQVTLDVTIETSAATRGLQFGVKFNPTVLRCDNVSMGPFYSDWANQHNSTAMMFPAPRCDNASGTITDMGIILLGTEPGGPIGTGVVATLHFTLLTTAYSAVELINVQVADDSPLSQELPSGIVNGAVNPLLGSTPTPTATATAFTNPPTVTLTPTRPPLPVNCAASDVNGDGVISVLDLTLIGSVVGQTGAPGWIPQDINRDGAITVLDLTAVGSCFTSNPTQPPTVTPTPMVPSVTPITPSPNTPTMTLAPGPTNTFAPTATPPPVGTNLVQVIAPSQPVPVGTKFTVTVDLNLSQASRGGQAGLTFNPAMVRCESVREGNFYSSWAAINGASTQLFPAPVINNTDGTISVSSVIILGGTGGPAGQGSLLIIEFTALAPGVSALNLVDPMIADTNFGDPKALTITTLNGSVSVIASSGPTATFTSTPSPTATATVSNVTPTVTATLATQSRLSVSPASQSVAIGQTFEITVQIEVLAPAASRGAQVAVSFNPAVMRCTQAAEGTFYKTWALANNSTTQLFPAPVIDNNAGTVSLSAVIILGTTPGGVNGTGSLIKFTCESIAAGDSQIRLSRGEVADTNTDRAEPLTLTMVDGTVTVTNQVQPSSTPTPTRTNTAQPVFTATSTIQAVNTATRTPTATSSGGGLPGMSTGTAPVINVPTVAANARMSVEPAILLVGAAGETFKIDITIVSDKPTRGAQVEIKYNPQIMSCQSVTEGTFYKSWATSNGGGTILYPEPIFDNNAGKMSVASVIITGAVVGGNQTAAGGPTTKGIFLSLNCTAKAVGSGAIVLQNVVLANDNNGSPKSLAVSLDNGQVFIGVTPTPGGAITPGSTGTGSGGTLPLSSGTPLSLTTTGTPGTPAAGTGTPAATAGIKADENSQQVKASAPVDSSGRPGLAEANIEGQVDDQGIVTANIEVTSPDNMVAVRIPQGAQVLTADNYALKAITFMPLDPVPDDLLDEMLISVPYELGPTGATFDPPATLILAYDKSRLPEGIKEKDSTIVLFDLKTKTWQRLKGVVDPESGTVSAEISHFSVYAVMARKPGVNWPLIIVVSLVVEGLIAAGYFYYRRKHKSNVAAPPPPIIYLPAPRSAVVDAEADTNEFDVPSVQEGEENAPEQGEPVAEPVIEAMGSPGASPWTAETNIGEEESQQEPI